MPESIKRGTRNLLVIVGLQNLSISFISAVYTVYLLAKGMTLLEAAVINTCFHLAIPLLEIPTGAVADIWGRKRSFIASAIIWVLSAVVYGTSTTMEKFIAAELIGALGYTLASGCLDALIWDTVAEKGSSVGLAAEKVNGLNSTITAWARNAGAVMAAIGGYAGSFLYNLDISLPWYVTGLCFAGTSIIALKLIPNEPVKHHNIRDVLAAIRKVAEVSIHGVRISVRVRALRRMLAFTALNNLALAPFFMFWQPKFTGITNWPLMLGVLWLLIQVSKVAGSYLGEKLRKVCSRYSLMAITTAGMVLTGAISAVAEELVIAVIAFVALEVLLSAQMFGAKIKNQIDITECGHGDPGAEKNLRATILSASSMLGGVGSAIGLSGGGYLSQHFTVTSSWLAASGVLMLELIMILLWARNGDG